VAKIANEPEYNQAVEIYGDWVSKERYSLTIKAGLPLGSGEVLKEDIRINLTSPEIHPYVGFGYPGRFYFPRQAGVPLKIESRNMNRAKLTLYRLFPNNLAASLEDIYDDEANWRFNEAWAERLAEAEITLSPGRDRLVETPIRVDELFLKNTRGVFSLEVSAPDESDAANRKIIVWTDIGVLSYWQKDGLALFAHDLYSLAPAANATVRVYSKKNQLLGSGSTNADGMLLLSGFSPLLGDPLVAVVEYGDDFTFLELTRRDDDPIAYTESMPNYNRKGYDAFLYADRELYRPGETAYLHWLVRTNYGDAVSGVPLKLRVLKPNGRTLLEKPVELSPMGTGGWDLETQKAYPTGKYAAELWVPGAKTPIGSYSFRVEDFVPNRIKVDLSLLASDRPHLLAGVNSSLTLTAQHLFGAPAVNRKAELSVLLMPGAPVPDAWKEFRFSNDSDFKPDKLACGEQVTDENGKATFTLNYPPSDKLTFPMRAIVVGRVFELGGRAVTGTIEKVFYPSDLCLGLAVSRRTQGPGVDVAVAAITPEGTPATVGSVKVTLEKQAWNYYVRRFYTHHEANWTESFEVVETRDIPITEGKGTTSFEIRDYGHYRVRVHAEATPQYSTQSFYSYGGECSLSDAARPSLIKLTLDKDLYQVGDTVRARVESPFDGKGVVVLQGETINKMATLDIRDGVGIVEFGLTRDHVPNVWIEATVVHALKADRAQVYPFSSFAMANVPVRDPVRKLDVALVELPEEILPASQHSFTVETKLSDGTPAETEVTVAAVDEGIHSITGYKSPDPVTWLFRDRKPSFNRAHYYDKVAYDFEKPAVGGDLEALLGKRTATPDDNWIKPLALWSGTVRTDTSGKATVTFQLPEFSGQLRLAVVACSGAAVGSTEGYVYVRRPYMLRTSQPRFVLPEDKFRCRALIFNTRDKAVKAKISWKTTGALVPGEGGMELDVPANGEASTLASFAAGMVPGQGAIQWQAVMVDEANNELERLTQETLLPVRTPAAYQTEHELVVLKPGESRSFSNTQFVEDERVEMSIAVSANPLLQLGKVFRDTVAFPYGCVEQVTSRLFPIYLLRQNLQLFDLSGTEAEDAVVDADKLRLYLNSGVTRLFAMQTPSGGLATWPGDSAPYPYGSVYALHFLTLVKRDREIPVPEEGYRALQEYVRRIALDWEKMNSSDLYLRAYALYVLASGGDIEALQQISRFDSVKIPRPARYLLAAALAANTQNTDRVALYLSSAPHSPYDTRELGGTLNSDLRAQAVELYALQQIKADPQEIAVRAERLATSLNSMASLNTQEAAFAIAALCQYLADSTKNTEQAQATITTPLGEKTIRAGEILREKHEGSGGKYIVANTGNTPLFVMLTVSGMPLKPNLEKVARGINVERSFYTPTGESIKDLSPLGLRQGDSYVVDICVNADQLPQGAGLENVVVTDLLPAGLEIENPRISVDAVPGTAFKGAVTPSYLEIRDDRLVLMFNSLPKGRHHYYYVVRSVTPGQYQHPPLVAECMYEPTIKGATAPSSLAVKE